MEAANPRALIADDQPDVLEALRLLLKREGYLIEAVNSPRAVLESLREREFDVLLMDLNYALDTTSGKEGLDLLAHIKRLDGNLPIVVMTAWGTVPIAVEAMRRGARDFVEKPWDNEHLLATLRAQVASRAAGRHEDDEAAAVQRNLLPREIPGLPGCQVAVSWQPARAVGGDYVDVLALEGPALALGIADVIGKGFGAGLLMSNVQAAVRSIAPAAAGPAEVAGRVNRILCGNTAPGRFVTMFYGVLDGQARALRYTNAGHCAPLVVRAAGSIERLERAGPCWASSRNGFTRKVAWRSRPATAWCCLRTASRKPATPPARSSARSGWGNWFAPTAGWTRTRSCATRWRRWLISRARTTPRCWWRRSGE